MLAERFTLTFTASSASSGNALSVLREKEEQIQQLLDEGEKLSRTQLQHTNIIKKLRSKEKESDTQITSLKYVRSIRRRASISPRLQVRE